MKILFAFSLITLSSSAMAGGFFVPGGDCQLEGERKYVSVGKNIEEVYVCQAGAWTYLFTRDAADQQD